MAVPHHLEGGIALDDLRDQLPHECGIVDDQNPDLLFHAGAPTALRRYNADRGSPSEALYNG